MFLPQNWDFNQCYLQSTANKVEYHMAAAQIKDFSPICLLKSKAEKSKSKQVRQ